MLVNYSKISKENITLKHHRKTVDRPRIQEKPFWEKYEQIEKFQLEAEKYFHQYLSGKDYPVNVDIVCLPSGKYRITKFSSNFEEKLWVVYLSKTNHIIGFSY